MMRVGIVGTGAIAWKHAQAYKNIGYQVTACTNTTSDRGLKFAEAAGAEFVPTVEQLCWHPQVDFADVCTLPAYRLPAVELCARNGKHVLVQKPMAIDLETAGRMIALARDAGIQLGVVSQHRFDDATLFLKRAIAEGRLGRILEADAYVKWHRSAAYYERPVKGSWAGEGGGALINQAIHQIDLLLHLIGPVDEVAGYWRLGGLHAIESEDSLNALLHYSSGALGVVQASHLVLARISRAAGDSWNQRERHCNRRPTHRMGGPRRLRRSCTGAAAGRLGSFRSDGHFTRFHRAATARLWRVVPGRQASGLFGPGWIQGAATGQGHL